MQDDDAPVEDAPAVAKQHDEAHVVTAEEAEAGKFSIYDLVLPLPGHDIILPAHAVADTYSTLLQADGLSMEDFGASKLRDMCLPGGYRKLLVKPGELDWAAHMYEDMQQPLCATGKERMLGWEKPLPAGGDKLGVRVSFSLSSSCYATMCMRELLKISTSTHDMTMLNDSQ